LTLLRDGIRYHQLTRYARYDAVITEVLTEVPARSRKEAAYRAQEAAETAAKAAKAAAQARQEAEREAREPEWAKARNAYVEVEMDRLMATGMCESTARVCATLSSLSIQ
jgi:hypothetical protein